jgi:hypothetical protein
MGERACANCRYFEDATRPPTKFYSKAIPMFWCRWSLENRSDVRKLPQWARGIKSIHAPTAPTKCPTFQRVITPASNPTEIREDPKNTA